jgi:hypothetical protein
MVYQLNSGSGIYELIALVSGGTTTSYTKTGLTPGVTYSFKVSAYGSADSANEGPLSGVATATIIEKPATPTISATTRGDETITLTFSVIATQAKPVDNINIYKDGVLVTTLGSSATSYTYTNLTAGTSYILGIAAVNSIGVSTIVTSTVVAVSPPGQVTGLNATVNVSSNTSLDLSWNAFTGTTPAPVVGYMVYQLNTSSGLYELVTLVAGQSTVSYTRTGLTSGVSYSFKISAYGSADSNNEGPLSATTTATPIGVPMAATNVLGTVGTSQVQLSWTNGTTSSGAPRTGLTVTTCTDSGMTTGCTTSNVSSNTDTSYTKTGLTNGTAYYFVVNSVNAAGTTISATSSPVTPITAPNTATDVAGTPDNQQVSLSWTNGAVSAAAPRSSLAVKTCTNSGMTVGCTTSMLGTSSDISYTKTGLTNGTTYYFQVNSINNVGTTSSVVSSGVTPRTVPDAPTSVAGTPGASQVSLSWSAPANNGGAAITDYIIESSLDGTNWIVFADGTSTSTSATVTGLTNGTAYTFRVSATNAAGTGATSTVSSSITPRTVPDAPTSVAGTPGASQVSLSWSAPANNGGAAITDYIVESSLDGTNWVVFADGTSTSTFATVTGLTNGTPYTFRVSATNEAGTGATSTASSSITPRTVPDAPTSVVGTPGNVSVALTWSAPANNGGAAITDYIIESSLDGTNWVVFADGASTSASATVTGLTNGTAYTFRVSATNAVGTGVVSTVSASVTPRTVPNAPTNVVGTLGDTQVALTWSAPANNGGAAITDYLIEYHNGSSWATFTDGTSTSASTIVTGLTNGTAYTFRVSATNAAGTGAASTVSGSVTPIGAPDASTSVGLTRGLSQIALAWIQATSTAGKPIVSVTVKACLDSAMTTSCTSVDMSTITTAAYTKTGLSSGPLYYFQIINTNAIGSTVSSTTSGTRTSISLEYLVVGGGGASGYSNNGLGENGGGGGGAGGFRTNVAGATSGANSAAEAALAVTTESFTVTVGIGGSAGNNGASSVFGSITSNGGGRGGEPVNGAGAGGSGGGRWHSYDAGAGSAESQLAGSGTAGQGFVGGQGDHGIYQGYTYSIGGPGGGASASNGFGLCSSITGTAVGYAGGGQGDGYHNFGPTWVASGISATPGRYNCAYEDVGTGGVDFGVGAAGAGGVGTAGTANKGGGGGAGRLARSAGGSGVVILAYPDSYPDLTGLTGLTYSISTTSRPGYKVYTFTAGTGTITFS